MLGRQFLKLAAAVLLASGIVAGGGQNAHAGGKVFEFVGISEGNNGLKFYQSPRPDSSPFGGKKYLMVSTYFTGMVSGSPAPRNFHLAAEFTKVGPDMWVYDNTNQAGLPDFHECRIELKIRDYGQIADVKFDPNTPCLQRANQHDMAGVKATFVLDNGMKPYGP